MSPLAASRFSDEDGKFATLGELGEIHLPQMSRMNIDAFSAGDNEATMIPGLRRMGSIEMTLRSDDPTKLRDLFVKEMLKRG